MQKLLIVLLALSWGVLGCPSAPGPDGDENETSSQMIFDGGTANDQPGDNGSQTSGDAGPNDNTPPPSNAAGTCADPYDLLPGGDTRAMPARESALVGSCGGAGPEAVYKFVLDEDSGVNIQVDGIDSVIYLLGGSCSAASEVENSCRDYEYAATPAEEINIAKLAAGTYYLVVDAYSTEERGTYNISWTVTPGGFCANDLYEPNQDADGAVSLGATDIDTAAIEGAEGEPAESVEFEICEGDVDFFSLGHMGGNLSLTATLTDEAGTITGEIFKSKRTGDEDTGYSYEEGESMGELPFDGALESGLYFLKMTGTAAETADGPNYTLAVVHECEPDSYDSYDPEYDDGSYENVSIQLNNTLPEPVQRKLCADDVDTVLLDNVIAGDITVTLMGGAGFAAVVQSVNEDVEDTEAGTDSDGGVADEEDVALTDRVADVADVGDDLVVTITDAAAGSYLLTISANGVPATTEYDLNAIFAGIADGPANDQCEEATTLLTDNVEVVGHTFNATDDVDGPTTEDVNSIGDTTISSCNGEPEADEAMAAAEEEGLEPVGTPADVFYYLNLAQAADFEINYDGSDNGFSAAVYMLISNGTCPVDLSSLPYVNTADGAPLCATGTSNRIRVDDLPAGDYLLVVDGVFREGWPSFGIPHSVTQGSFKISAQDYPDGFPPIESCANATIAELPTSGNSVEFTVDQEDGYSWIDSYENCGSATNASGGQEVIFVLEPTDDMTLTIQATGDYDTVVEVREANTEEPEAYQCEKGIQVACNDDGTGVANLGSLLEDVSLTGGKIYYLVVDAYSSYSSGEVTVTLTAE